LTEVFDKFSEDKVLTGIESLLAYSEKKFRAKISEIPDGTYEFVDYLDDDGITNEYIPIKVAVTIKGDKIHLDFTGSAPQVDGAINVVWHALSATVYYALKAFIDPTLPPNGGFFRAVHINAPKHTIVNATPPAAVGARTDTCQRIASVVIGALGNALPEKAVASSNDTSTTVVLAMYDKNKQKECVYVEAIAGGAGARSNKDGMDGVQVHITNTSNLPIEALEIEYPSLLIERYTFITDSGGPGRFRGGMGLLREIRILDGVVRFSSHGDHHKNPPLGISDGLPGGTGRFTLLRKNGQTIIIPSKTSQVNLYEGDVLRIQSPGGGGYGNPLERDRKLVLKDVKEGRVSIEKAVSMYGTNIRPEDILDDV
jgi:N-methylhydantoinase B